MLRNRASAFVLLAATVAVVSGTRSASAEQRWYTPASANDTFNSASNWSTSTTGNGAPGNYVGNVGVPTATANAAGDQAEFSAAALAVNGVAGPITIDTGANQSVLALAFRADGNQGTLSQDITFNNNTITLYGLANNNAIVYQAQNTVTFNSNLLLVGNLTFFSGGNVNKGVIVNGNIGETGGSYRFSKTQAGRLVVNGTISTTGVNTVSAGSLFLNGSVTTPGGVTASGGSTIGGTGTLAGTLAISASGSNNTTVSPGFGGAGTLTTGGLTLANVGNLAYDLDAPGGAGNDLIAVNGNLTLDGRLVINAGPNFGVGTYSLLTYTGTLTDNVLTVLTAPANFNYAIDTATPGRINLVVSDVPEPTTLAAIGIAGVALLGRRRRLG